MVDIDSSKYLAGLVEQPETEAVISGVIDRQGERVCDRLQGDVNGLLRRIIEVAITQQEFREDVTRQDILDHLDRMGWMGRHGDQTFLPARVLEIYLKSHEEFPKPPRGSHARQQYRAAEYAKWWDDLPAGEREQLQAKITESILNERRTHLARVIRNKLDVALARPDQHEDLVTPVVPTGPKPEWPGAGDFDRRQTALKPDVAFPLNPISDEDANAASFWPAR